MAATITITEMGITIKRVSNTMEVAMGESLGRTSTMGIQMETMRDSTRMILTSSSELSRLKKALMSSQ